MAVAEAQTKISSREFAEWVAYDRLEPFGPRRNDLGHAIVASTIANAFRDDSKKKDPFVAADFLPIFSDLDREELDTAAPPPLSEEDMWAKVALLNARLGGVDKTRDH